MNEMYFGDRVVKYRKGSADLGIITFFADFDESDLNKLFDSLPNATIYALKIEDWNNELSPWKVPAVFGKDDFGDGASKTLEFILECLIPEMKCERYMIGGYSLAGLFSIWVCYHTDVFYGCAASSPSVWFDGWIDFINGHKCRAQRIYLSLGDREHNTKNQRMRKVKGNILYQNDVLSETAECTIEWNKGGHFDDVLDRKIRSFRFFL